MAALSFLLLRPITSEYILMTFFPIYIQCIRKPPCFHRIIYPEWNHFLPGPWLPPSPSHHHLSPGQCLSHVPVSSCCPCHLQFVLLTSAYVYISQNLSYCSEPCSSNSPEEKPELEGAPLFRITALPASPFFVSGTMAHLHAFSWLKWKSVLLTDVSRPFLCPRNLPFQCSYVWGGGWTGWGLPGGRPVLIHSSISSISA